MSEASQIREVKPNAGDNSPSDMSTDEAEVAVVRFRVKECYLYSIPSAGNLGHRAEMWDVNKWLKVGLSSFDFIGSLIFGWTVKGPSSTFLTTHAALKWCGCHSGVVAAGCIGWGQVLCPDV